MKYDGLDLCMAGLAGAIIAGLAGLGAYAEHKANDIQEWHVNSEFRHVVQEKAAFHGVAPETYCASWSQLFPDNPLYGEHSSYSRQTTDIVCLINGQVMTLEDLAPQPIQRK